MLPGRGPVLPFSFFPPLTQLTHQDTDDVAPAARLFAYVRDGVVLGVGAGPEFGALGPDVWRPVLRRGRRRIYGFIRGQRVGEAGVRQGGMWCAVGRCMGEAGCTAW